MANSDKWGHPFFYATKKTAGLTNEDEGFFWQQNNDIFKDNDKGMVRLGKEYDDVEVINTTTGEWEFPFVDDGDALALEVTTGHHSGGEDKGCQGFEYKGEVFLDVNPAKFRYQKEMYHGGPHTTDPQTKTWTHSKANFKIIGSGWFGFGITRFNRKKGQKNGGDSVVLELWFNPNPDVDKKNWHKLKTTEDKGEGISNWGEEGTRCNGTTHQVGTWSNIQFRFKCGASDFSLHPLKPEFEDGPNIHSIGGENMDFEETEKRGYGYRKDMPRDVEMKGMFKFDSSSHRKCRIKNLSLREIDPGIDLVDNPTSPVPSTSPGSTKTVRGVMVYKWDVNQSRTSPCAVVGSAVFYEVLGFGDDRVLSNHTEHDFRTRIGEEVLSFLSPLESKIIEGFRAAIWKNGTPHGSAVAKIWNSAGSVVYTGGSITATSLPVEGSVNLQDPSTWPTFSFSSNSHKMVTGDIIGIEYTGTDPDNNVEIAYAANIIPGSCYTARKYSPALWEKQTSRDCCFQLLA